MFLPVRSPAVTCSAAHGAYNRNFRWLWRVRQASGLGQDPPPGLKTAASVPLSAFVCTNVRQVRLLQLFTSSGTDQAVLHDLISITKFSAGASETLKSLFRNFMSSYLFLSSFGTDGDGDDDDDAR